MIRLVRSGNIDLFGELINRHQRLVISIVRRAACDPSEMEDLAQEVFIRAFKGLNKFRGEAKFSTWLGQIAYRTAADSMKRRRDFEVGETELDLIDLDRPITEKTETPEVAWAEEDEREWVRGLVEKLPADYRQVVSLHYFHGKSVEEVGEITGLPAGTVKSHLHRARHDLRRLIERERKKGEVGRLV